LISRAGRLLVLLCALAALLAADGGTLQVRQTSGPFTLSVFTSPAVLRAGNIDFSVLVQDGARLDPVLGAEVEVRAENADGIIISKAATHDGAQNKLLYAALLNLPRPGEWTFTVHVRQQKSEAQIVGKLIAGPREPRFLAHWPQLAFVPVSVLLFAIHQRLKRRQRARIDAGSWGR
jgi:hypothetical protein